MGVGVTTCFNLKRNVWHHKKIGFLRTLFLLKQEKWAHFVGFLQISNRYLIFKEQSRRNISQMYRTCYLTFPVVKIDNKIVGIMGTTSPNSITCFEIAVNFFRCSPFRNMRLNWQFHKRKWLQDQIDFIENDKWDCEKIGQKLLFFSTLSKQYFPIEPPRGTFVLFLFFGRNLKKRNFAPKRTISEVESNQLSP